MANPPAVLDGAGNPVPSEMIRAIKVRAGYRAMLGAGSDGSAIGGYFPYEAASLATEEMSDWVPRVHSPDYEINYYRDRMVARARDLVRNDAWAKGAIGRILDSTIGAEYRLVAKPDYRALRLYAPEFDVKWAREFRQVAEARWRMYAEDIGRYNDLERELTASQQFRLMLGHQLVDGECLEVAHWRPERIGRTAARYATCFQVVNPDRLSNPQELVDSKYLRGGVEIDDDGVRVAWHIRKAHQNDWYNTVESMQWERVPREDNDGFRRVIHDFDRDWAGQHRGVSIFTPVIARLKMLARYYGVRLQQEVINSVFGTYITSPFDREEVYEALSDGREPALTWYQNMRKTEHTNRALMLNGARIPTLVPGEDIKTVTPQGPPSEFSPFTHEMLRSLASVLGISAEQVTQDYSEASWSSARAGIVEAEKSFKRRLGQFNRNVATAHYAAWMYEAMESGEFDEVLPRNAPSFLEGRTAYCRALWLGAARGWVDPVAERQGAILGLDAGFSTLEAEAAQQGMDFEENIEQRAYEVAMFKEHDLELPEWGGRDITATQAAQKPQAE